MLNQGFRGKSFQEIESNLDDYFIINYFGVDDYMGQGDSGVPGHIPGAYQFTPYASLAMDQMLDNIPADMPVVVYGWTGQHSAQLVTFLNMLGYEAYSLKFGANALFHSLLMSHCWNGNSLELPLETVLDAPRAPTTLQVSCYPNPFNPRVSVTAELSRPGATEVGVYDLAGRRVARLASGHREAGRHSWTWNGRDDRDRAAPTGTYLLRVVSGAETVVRKMALAR
jgi:hypothetical protein